MTKNGHTPSAKRDDVSSNSEVHLSKIGPGQDVKKIIRVKVPIRSGGHSILERQTARVGIVDDGLEMVPTQRPMI